MPRPPTPQRSPRSPNIGRLALALLGLVAVIGVGSRFVRTNSTASAGVEPTATPTLTEPVADVPLPTAAAPPAAASPNLVPATAPSATTSNAPSTASRRTVLAGDHAVATVSGGVWVRARQASEWQFVPQPLGLQRLGCASVFGHQVAFTARTADTTAQQLVVLDVPTLEWTVTRLPRADEDAPGQRRADFCTGIELDVQWVFATTYLDTLLFATSRDQGATFALREFPLVGVDDAAAGRATSSTVELAAGTDRFLADICVIDNDSSCGVNAIVFPNSALSGTEDRAIDWVAAGAAATEPSPLYAGRFTPGITGPAAQNQSFEVGAVGDAIWRSELRRSNITFEAFDPRVNGTWSAGPVDRAPVPLPTGLRPRLFPYGDDVVAEVALESQTSASGGRVVEWWRLADGSTEWTRMPSSPVVDWAQLAPGTAVSLVSAGLDGGATLVIPRYPRPEQSEP